MSAPSPEDILQLWERGQGLHPIELGLTMLSYANPKMDPNELREYSIGKRDRDLLNLYGRAFGNILEGFADCPRCSEHLEFDVAIDDITAKETQEPYQQKFTDGNLTVSFRLINITDLASITGFTDLDAARRTLAQRCIVDATRGGKVLPTAELTDEDLSKLSAQLAECDPQSEILLDISCPACGNTWQILIDVVSFLWARINSHAKQLLYEVGSLARSFGWSESEILAMNPSRRRFYLEMVS
jgi:hypothetical protein